MGMRKDSFLFRWITTTVAVMAASQVVGGIRYESWPALLVTALLLGIFNAFLRPVLVLLTLPLQILTLGLFTLVINALLLMLAGGLVRGFEVAGFWPAFWAALLISVVNGLLGWLLGGSPETRAAVQVDREGAARRSPGGGDGPVIDV